MRASPPLAESRLATSEAASLLLVKLIATLAPSKENLSAMARPIPLLAPVIRAVRPASLPE